MKRTIFIVTISLALAAMLPAVSAQAQNARSFVSSTGSDSNNCTLATPCRTLQVAFNNTNAGGEIDVLNTAGYGILTINKAISIVNPGGFEAGIIVPSGGVGIVINAGANDAVSLRGLTVEGGGIGHTGIQFNTGKFLTIENCVIRHVTLDGIDIFPTAATGLSIANTVASDNGQNGIYIAPKNLGSVQGAITSTAANNNNYIGIGIDGQFTTGTTASAISIVRSVTANNNLAGVSAQNGTAAMSVLVRDSNSSHNVFAGFQTTTGAVMRLAHSVATGNNQGISSSGTIFTYGDNDINGNTGTDINATLTTIAMH